MHMSDALLSPSVAATFWAGSLAGLAYCARKLKERIDEKIIPLMGVLGAFIFAAQMINFTIPGTGSSGHIGGGMILAVILGSHAAFIAIASVLTIQSFFFADGGLLAIGCNIWNLGVYPCFIAYPFIYRLLIQGNSSPKRIIIASLLSVIAGLQLGAFSVVLQTFFSGRSELPIGAFTLVMLPIHFLIGIAEGFITAGVINYVKIARPDLFENKNGYSNSSLAVASRKIAFVFLMLALITGGVFSWFASSNPDGLEWAIEKVYGKAELPEAKNRAMKSIRDKTAVLPDYNFKKGENGERKDMGDAVRSKSVVNSGASVSGILGSLMVMGAILVCGAVIRLMKMIKNKKR